jgi:hypothetical protein
MAKLEITDIGCRDTFQAIHVTIMDKLSGTIDSKTFRFDDYLSFDLKDRKDDRKDYEGGFYGWLDGSKLDWYIAVPKSVVPITRALVRYLDLFELLDR